MFELVFKHFWLLALIIGFVNYYILKNRIRPIIEENPDLQPGYDQLLTWLFAIGTGPWLFMGAAILSGEVDTVFEFLSPREGPWVVQLFWGCIATGWLSAMAWIVLGSGAEFLERHPGIIQFNMPSVDPFRPTARQIRYSMLFFLIIGIVVFGTFFSGVVPHIPHEIPPK